MRRGGRTAPVRRVGLAAIAVIATAACSPSDDAEVADVAESSAAGSSTADSVTSTGSSTAPSTSTPSGPARVAARWEPIAEGADPDDLPAAPPGALTLDACRWRSGSAFSFDVTWSPTVEDAAPARVPLALGFVIGDQAVAAVGTATFEAAGAYTVDAVIRTGDDDDNGSERGAGRRHPLAIGDLPCFGSTLGAVESPLGSVPLVADPRPADADADTGTIEGQAASIDLLDADAPLLPLAWLHADPEPPALDRLYVHPTEMLNALSVERDGACILVRSSWGDDGEVAEIVQHVGCPPQLSPDEWDTVPIEDDVWDVVVQGPAGTVEAFARELTLLWSEEVAPFDPAATAFDVDRFLDEHLADYELDELQRFDWESGRVLVAMSVAGLMGLDVLAVTPDGFNGGGTGLPCQDLAISMNADATGSGFVVVAVRGDAIATIDEDGPGSGTPVDIPLAASQVDDIRVGFHDLDMPMLEFDVGRVVVTDADGSPRACVQ